MDWSVIPTIAEAVAMGLSVLGITGLGWWLAIKIVDKIAGNKD